MSKSWFKTIRKVLLLGADAAKEAFPTKLVSRLTRDELVKKAKGILAADFTRIGYTVSKTQLRKEAKATREASTKPVVAPVVVKTAAKKPGLQGTLGKPAPVAPTAKQSKPAPKATKK